jgi:ubiquinone/menaquinone biosynthesis C-methylase UbiE
MIDEISQVFKSHPEYGERKLKILDIGGGKGMLSNLLAETFGEGFVEVQVVDISRSATNNGMLICNPGALCKLSILIHFCKSSYLYQV